MTRPSILLAVIAFVVALGAGAWTSGRRVDQPYPFNHSVHVKGASCTLCHQGVRTAAHAGIPDLNFCTGCHAVPPGRPSAAEEALFQRAIKGEGVPWNRLYQLPRHVYFSHRRHVVLANRDCAECHGDIAQRTAPPAAPVRITKMRDCLGCHEQEKVTVDCTGCHR
jgi:hypothetical protein